jgi:hypothetical protein
MSRPDVSELQWRFIRETLVALYVEVDASDNFSQGMIDDLSEVLTILGVDVDDIK